jgi:hypothetical protein
MFRLLLAAIFLPAVTAGASEHWHWSFKAPVRHEPPSPGHPVDAFIDARLAAAGIEPAAEADPATLMRRLHLDLTGLLPTGEGAGDQSSEVRGQGAEGGDQRSWVEDEIDRLLDSPHFGERWGRHWLDLSRYADSDGYLGDTERAWAWRYRDWVVEAINRDLPYDRFSIEQIAGDLLPEATVEQRIATGFHRNALRNTEAGVDKELARTQEVIDRVNAVATTWLALTLACAECHNHKHDPLKQEEFYRVYAFFNNLEDADPFSPFPEEVAKYERDLAAWTARSETLEASLAGESAALAERQAAWEQSLTILPKPGAWTVLVPDKAESGAGDEMKVSEDGIVLATAKKSDPDTVTYTLEAPLPEALGRIASFRLEALGSPGEGRVAGISAGRGKDGAFALSDFSAQLREADGTTRTLALAKAEEPLWSVAAETRRAHAASFVLKEPASPGAGARLVLTLRHKEGGGSTLRRFRLSASGLDAPPATDLPDAVLAALTLPPGQRDEAQLAAIAAHYRALDPAWSALRLEFDAHLAKAPAKPSSKIQSVAERGADRRGSYVHVRGDYMRRGDEVSPGVPAVLHPLKPRQEGAEPDRLDFARWLFDEANPLTARVAVNQIWQHLFGVGLVSTPDDFGTEGAAPTHPELLDWLATEFRRLGWSRKELIRLIVSSQAYRRSSAIPAAPPIEATDNTLLWRQNRYRVEAETVRDLHLAASGLLSRKLGGKPVRPPLPGFVTEVGRSVGWPESQGEDRYRRGLYIFLKRTVMYPSLTAFDAPDTTVACSRRDRTQSPMQALTLLNDPVFYECAEALGKSLAETCGNDSEGAVAELFRRCLGRDPEPAERDALLSAHADFVSASDPSRALAATARVVLNLDEFITRE